MAIKNLGRRVATAYDSVVETGTQVVPILSVSTFGNLARGTSRPYRLGWGSS